MTETDLAALVHEANKSTSFRGDIEMLSASVGRRVVRQTIPGEASGFVDRDVFFVFAGEQCVGAVYVAGNLNEDIHALTLPEHRRRGHMISAFKDMVFPTLAAEGYKEYHVTVNSKEGAMLLRALGENGASVGDEIWIDLTRFQAQADSSGASHGE